MSSQDTRASDRRNDGDKRPGPPRDSFADRLGDRLGSGSLLGLLGKLVFLGVINATALYTVVSLLPDRAWTPIAVVTIATLALDVVYLSRRTLPLKFLLPGTIALLIFRVDL